MSLLDSAGSFLGGGGGGQSDASPIATGPVSINIAGFSSRASSSSQATAGEAGVSGPPSTGDLGIGNAVMGGGSMLPVIAIAAAAVVLVLLLAKGR